MNVNRSERVADRVLRELAQLVQLELDDPRIGFVTITSLRLSPDLRHARVYVTTPESSDPEAQIDALNRAVPFLRRGLARRAGLRFTPSLRFYHDDVLEDGMRVERILDGLHLHDDPQEPE